MKVQESGNTIEDVIKFVCVEMYQLYVKEEAIKKKTIVLDDDCDLNDDSDLEDNNLSNIKDSSNVKSHNNIDPVVVTDAENQDVLNQDVNVAEKKERMKSSEKKNNKPKKTYSTKGMVLSMLVLILDLYSICI